MALARLPTFQIRIIGPGGERLERLQKPVMILGRSPECDVIVADNEVSRRHLEIKLTETGVMILDLGSKNGSFIEGRRLNPRQTYAWRAGQTLRLGLATEQLELVQDGQPARDSDDGPPPVDSVSRRISKREPQPVAASIVAPKLNIDLNAKVPSPHPVGEAKEDSIWLGLRKDLGPEKVEVKIEDATEISSVDVALDSGADNEDSLDFGKTDPKVSGTPSPSPSQSPSLPEPLSATEGPSLMKDLENRMNELMKKAELDAKNILTAAESTSAVVVSAAEEAKKEASQKAEELSLEKARIDGQVRDLKAEVVARHDERKAVARELADAKLRLQQLREEKERYEAACKQLPMQIRGEIAELEDRHFQLQEKVNQADEQASKNASREAKEMIDKARKQVELLLAEGEMKAKAQREKLQMELADERRTAELDLAELKLKEVAGIKTDQDLLARDLGQSQGKAAESFLAALTVRMDGMAAKGDLSPEAKLLIATEVERLTSRYLGDITGSMGAVVKPFPVQQELPPPTNVRRFSLRSVAVSGIAMMLFAVVTWQVIRTRPSSTQMASTAPVRKPVVVAAPVAAPVVPAPETAPVAAQPPVVPQAVVNNVVDEVQATTVVERPLPVENTPSSSASTKPVSKATWAQILNGSNRDLWNRQSVAFLQSMRLDRVKISRYQALEIKLSQNLKPRGRALASDRDRRRLEAQFARDASRLLGEKAWAKMLSFRNRFASKNR